jgi:GT2 family glycosyltransferase
LKDFVNEFLTQDTSKTVSNLVACVNSVRRHETSPYVSIIVVDDGVNWSGEPIRRDTSRIIPGEKPFIYSRNCNLGIREAGDDDVILLNDDGLLETSGGFTAMQRLAQQHPEFGVIGATCNVVGNVRQHPQPGTALRIDPRMVCFVCVLIPRRTIDVVGLLDEDFTAYSHQDDDYCLRVRRAGLKVGICDGCFVDHSKLTSTFRSSGGPGGDLRAGEAIFRNKWGTYPF